MGKLNKPNKLRKIFCVCHVFSTPKVLKLVYWRRRAMDIWSWISTLQKLYQGKLYKWKKTNTSRCKQPAEDRHPQLWRHPDNNLFGQGTVANGPAEMGREHSGRTSEAPDQIHRAEVPDRQENWRVLGWDVRPIGIWLFPRAGRTVKCFDFCKIFLILTLNCCDFTRKKKQSFQE